MSIATVCIGLWFLFGCIVNLIWINKTGKGFLVIDLIMFPFMGMLGPSLLLFWFLISNETKINKIMGKPVFKKGNK